MNAGSLRIPVDCNDGAGSCPHAPVVGGELEIGGVVGNVLFLIDTGADLSMVDPAAFPLPKEVMKRGRRRQARGIGGSWPSREFKNAKFSVLALDQRDEELAIQLELPRIQAMAPYAEQKGDKMLEELGPVARTDRRLAGRKPRLNPSPVIMPLLGRDVFRENKLTLEWNPSGESCIHVPLLP